MNEHTMSMYANRDDMIAALQADLTAERTAREAAEAENARLRQDAERYRFLRVRLTGGEAKVFLHHRPDEAAASAVDVAIDRARTLLTPITRTDGEGEA